ncbi:S-layer homology domain-containing protein [Bacillus cereus]|uniref:S-layer homology domain-containing protein n=1 Tax=Bacillus cereus TaxID=1396 RepID=UPI0028681858|nr:S-layer homology domain-containing protein [Bacillus cereus]WMW40654.1 S-layer homology domain-containing protein [Bacillus cereus]
MKHKLIATGILAGAILSYSSNILADTHKFPDVPTWADKSVNYLVDKQVLNGYPDGTFGSNDSLDRASATKIMTKVLGIQIDPTAKPSFTDSQNHWATPYIAAAEKAGIVKGEGNGIFNPSGKVTRAAMATMLVNAYKLQSTPNHNDQVRFEDLKGHWGEKYANILIDLKISNGTENGWQPNRFITRAEAAQLTAKTDMLQQNLNDEKEVITATSYEDLNLTLDVDALSNEIPYKMYADGSSSNVVSSAAYYQVPYPFNLKIKSRPDVAVEENKVGTVTPGTTIFIYREDPNGWVEFSFEANGEKYWTLKNKLSM